MTGTIDVLRAIAEGRGPSRWIVALGYAGWGEGQLDEEMTRHGWFAAPGDAAILFDTPTDERWAAAFKAEGIDPRLLASETGRGLGRRMFTNVRSDESVFFIRKQPRGDAKVGVARASIRQPITRHRGCRTGKILS